VNAITTDPDMLSEDSAGKALQILDAISDVNLSHDSADSAMASLSNLLCAFKIISIDSDKTFKDS